MNDAADGGRAPCMKFVYAHALVFGLWAAANAGLFHAVKNFDHDLVVLNTVATVEAIFLATFVLIAQNRMASNAEVRNHLDVQVSLLVESETTHILRLVSEISRRMGIEGSADPEILELIRHVEPSEIIDQIERQTES